jgi:hypothetical protein
MFIANSVLSFFLFLWTLFAVVKLKLVVENEPAAITAAILKGLIIPALFVSEYRQGYGIISAGTKRVAAKNSRYHQIKPDEKASFFKRLQGIG